MDALRKKARELLENKTVQVVIGYESGTDNNVRAAFITDPDKTDKLIHDERCVQNIALYVVKSEVHRLGKMAIVANVSSMRSLNVMISENQVKEENIVVLTVTPDGNVKSFTGFDEVEAYLRTMNLDIFTKDKEALAKIKNLSVQERWDYWQQELSRCIRCYACRATCPMCFCKRCITDCNQPNWIPVSTHINGNFDWHITRAMHLVGRCVSCGDCGRACPVYIPIHMLTIFTASETLEQYGVTAGATRKQDSVLSTFKPDDKENFII
jgi:ferredoxin